MTLLLVEDHPGLAGFLARVLSREGHEVTVVDSPRAARLHAERSPPDLVVIDAALADAAASDVLLRTGLPILCLQTGRPVPPEVGILPREGLDTLVAKLDGPGHSLRAGELVVDTLARRATWRATELRLTGQDLALLTALLHGRGEVVSRSMLLQEAWGVVHDPGTNVVDVAVSHLRRRLEPASKDLRIETVRGRGYRLCLGASAAA